MAQKKPDLAVKAYEQAFAISKSGPLIVKLHASLSHAGKGKEAASRLTQWLKEHPTDISTRMYLAGTYLADRQNKEAIEQYEIILRQEPKYVPALNNLAWLYQQTGDPRALRIAENAYKLAPGNPAIQDTLGWLLVQGNQAARGRDLLAKAAAASDSPSIRFHYAAALEKTGDKAKARLELVRTLKSTQPFSEKAQAEALLKSL